VIAIPDWPEPVPGAPLADMRVVDLTQQLRGRTPAS